MKERCCTHSYYSTQSFLKEKSGLEKIPRDFTKDTEIPEVFLCKKISPILFHPATATSLVL
jgi:hypothetical protein